MSRALRFAARINDQPPEVTKARGLNEIFDIDASRLALSPTKRLAIKTLGYGTSAKLMLPGARREASLRGRAL
jgi:hypothetical protein